MYELLLEDLLKKLEENGIDTSKLNIIEDTEETKMLYKSFCIIRLTVRHRRCKRLRWGSNPLWCIGI